MTYRPPRTKNSTVSTIITMSITMPPARSAYHVPPELNAYDNPTVNVSCVPARPDPLRSKNATEDESWHYSSEPLPSDRGWPVERRGRARFVSTLQTRIHEHDPVSEPFEPSGHALRGPAPEPVVPPTDHDDRSLVEGGGKDFFGPATEATKANLYQHEAWKNRRTGGFRQ